MKTQCDANVNRCTYVLFRTWYRIGEIKHWFNVGTKPANTTTIIFQQAYFNPFRQTKFRKIKIQIRFSREREHNNNRRAYFHTVSGAGTFSFIESVNYFNSHRFTIFTIMFTYRRARFWWVFAMLPHHGLFVCLHVLFHPLPSM